MDRSQLFQRLFQSPHPIWIYDRESLAFLDVNDEAVRRYGYSREEFLRLRITDIRPEEDVPRLREHLIVRSQSAAPFRWSGLWSHRAKDGREFAVEIVSLDWSFDGRPAVLVAALSPEETGTVAVATVSHMEEIATSLTEREQALLEPLVDRYWRGDLGLGDLLLLTISQGAGR